MITYVVIGICQPELTIARMSVAYCS